MIVCIPLLQTGIVDLQRELTEKSQLVEHLTHQINLLQSTLTSEQYTTLSFITLVNTFKFCQQIKIKIQ